MITGRPLLGRLLFSIMKENIKLEILMEFEASKYLA